MVPRQVGLGLTYEIPNYNPNDTSTRPRVVAGEPIRILGSNGEWVTPMGASGGAAGIWNQLLAQGVNVGSQVAAQYLNRQNAPAGQWVNGQWVTNPNDLQFAVGSGGISGLASISPGMIAAGFGVILLIVLASSLSVSKRK